MVQKKAITNSQARFVPLPGSHRELLPHSRQAGSIDPAERTSITVRTRPAGDEKDLADLLKTIYREPVASRKYSSYDEMARRHGARPEDLNALEQYGQQHNLLVTYRNPAERTLVLSGRLGDVLNAFHANVHIYHHASGTYRGRQGEIMIPRRFEGIITGIFGFDTRPKRKAPYRQRMAGRSGPGDGNGVSAADFAKHYNFPTAAGATKLDGSGQTIAIIELGGGFNNSDLEIFFEEIGVPLPKVVAVSVDHAQNSPTPSGAADGEVMLDIEVAGAVAPGANLAVYFAPNRGNGFLDAINAAVHDSQRKPSVVSISWGGPEESEVQAIKAFHEVFMEAAALGVTICAASGDHGTADLDATQWDKAIHVDHPASDDMVLACGGTQLESGKDVTWNDGTAFSAVGGGWATGGGVSTIVPLPDYQKKAKVPASLANKKRGRGVPDIAMSATNYFTRVQGQEGASGGTSAVAPLMSGLVALLNQAKKKNVGFMNPFLYANARKGAVKDVTKGTNAIAGTVKGYKARKGWDACTGLGTPDGSQILKLL
jgi:kumamolisin